MMQNTTSTSRQYKSMKRRKRKTLEIRTHILHDALHMEKNRLVFMEI